MPLFSTDREVSWNSQDGCELFIDAVHAASGSALTQYARYGDQKPRGRASRRPPKSR